MFDVTVVGYGIDSTTNAAYWLVKLAWGKTIANLNIV